MGKTRVVHCKKEKFCIDCGESLSRTAFYTEKVLRCKRCAAKLLHAINDFPISLSFKGKKKGRCLDCGREVGGRTKRCSKCYHVARKPFLKGTMNPNWRGGIAKLPYKYEFNSELKMIIFKRDSYTCQFCFVYPSNRLSTHHIDYDKENNVESNLITLCRGCNTKANFNRPFHQKYFEVLLRGRGYA